MSMLQILILIHTCFPPLQETDSLLERRMKLFFFSCLCVCIKKAQCGVTTGLYCTTVAFPCQQEEGLDTTDTQVYVFVFCLCNGKTTGRTVIMIKEQLCPLIHMVFSYTIFISQNQEFQLYKGSFYLVILCFEKSVMFAEENAALTHLH